MVFTILLTNSQNMKKLNKKFRKKIKLRMFYLFQLFQKKFKINQTKIYLYWEI